MLLIVIIIIWEAGFEAFRHTVRWITSSLKYRFKHHLRSSVDTLHLMNGILTTFRVLIIVKVKIASLLLISIMMVCCYTQMRSAGKSSIDPSHSSLLRLWLLLIFDLLRLRMVRLSYRLISFLWHLIIAYVPLRSRHSYNPGTVLSIINDRRSLRRCLRHDDLSLAPYCAIGGI